MIRTDKEQPEQRATAFGDGPHLFIDNHLIARSENLTKVLHPPKRLLSEPVLDRRHGTTQPFLSIVRDPSSGRFRAWFGRDNPAREIAYVESDDGLHWGAATTVEVPGEVVNKDGCSLIDDGPDCPQPERRFKLAWHTKKLQPQDVPGMRVAFSADGLRWTPSKHNPVVPDYASRDDLHPENLTHPLREFSCCDIVDVFRDPIRQCYRLFCKTPALPSDGYAPAPRAYTLIRRLVSASVSEDFEHWERTRRVIAPDPCADGFEEYYGVGGTIARGNLLIGFLRVLRDDLAAEPGGPTDGIGWTELVTSRDGLNWQRHDGAFFDRSNRPGDWDRAMAWIGSVLPMGDELWLYYGGYKLGHKVGMKTERKIGLVKMPMDRFVSRRAGNVTGTLTTVPFAWPAESRELTVNADLSAGELRVEALDEDGYPITELPARAGGLDELLGRVVHLKFHLRNADLFGFGFKAGAAR